jgi:hypothetical protein
MTFEVGIGSVNLTEFFVATTETIMFVAALGPSFLENWPTIAGLLAGGAVAAPFAACIAKRLLARTLMILVGVLIIVLSIRTIILTFAG